MLTYGIESGGDWLQLCAGSAWLLANITSLLTADPGRQVERAAGVRETRVLE